MITRAAQKHQASHMRPAGHVFETTELEDQSKLEINANKCVKEVFADNDN